MKRQNIVLLSFFITSITLAQNGVVASGGDASGADGTVAYSVGQVAYTFASSGEGSINPGMQQPYFMIMVGTDESDITITPGVYPNPVKNSLTLRLADAQQIVEAMELSYYLYDIQGRLLREQKITSEVTIVSMEELVNDVYLICIKRNDSVIKTFKIFKSN
jgi:hypothetical protein